MSYDPFAAPPGHHYSDSTTALNNPHAQPEQLQRSSTYKDVDDGLNETFQPGAVGTTQAREVPVARGKEEDFDPFQPPPKSTGDLRMWRQDHHGNLWAKGGRGRCIGRFCCCSIMTAILLIVSIVLTLALFLRPPDIEFSGIQPTESGSAVTANSTALTVNLGIGISVRNPNFFAVSFKSIKVDVTYPINDTKIGGGEEDNISFASNSKTSFTFPFAIQYSEQADPDASILKDIVSRCGFLPGSTKRQLSVNYKLALAIRVIFFTISPPISGTANFDCPLTESDIKPLIASIPGLSGILR
ncbi:hypothetical protein M422DRAFT_31846 [Sphaerobolus stellatus SS14]|uniref:Late embryogenesis abundant protein LEA-2 subgroup domain-containing protein n=1 Tax=Sphaerobolus stellatus (strain SS14) TaxID=990650 RepID=A0A0C9VIC3_SPHS4|nr:hypothetical protein M422DRAFT_31846 [Sphaerobolus stellatus SS14]